MSNKHFDLNFNEVKNIEFSSTRRIPICLVLDVSGSMARNQNIDTLNENVSYFLNFVRNNPKSRRIADISIVLIGGGVNVYSYYKQIDEIEFNPFVPFGSTPMGEAMELAIKLLQDRKQYYRQHEIEHYKPIILLMTDGAPTDSYKKAAQKTSQIILDKEVKLYPVGIGDEFDPTIMREFSPLITPRVLENKDEVALLFQLLSQSSSNPEDDSLDQFFNDEF